jgi:hypothetical protein
MFILLMTGTSKTYDRTEYFKIKDQIRENMKTIQLIGYHDNNCVG